MSRLAKLQLAGPVLLALVIVAEELAAYWLAHRPSSALAWYLNLELFGIFQQTHAMLAGVWNMPCLQLILVAAPILMLAVSGVAFGGRLPLAMASNLSLVYALFLAYVWYGIRLPSLQASLGASVYDAVFNFSATKPALGPHVWLVATLLLATLLSSAAAHLQYLRAVRAH
jgi:hypothetical protein